MKRTTEPELMIDPQQVQSYFNSDRTQTKYLFKIVYQSVKKQSPATLVDLGCGPGDLTAEMSEIHPNTQITGIDASGDMIALAKETDNVKFKQMPITEVTDYYDRVISSMTLHHFHNPQDFWDSIKRINPKDIFVFDLVRPESEEALEEIIKDNEPYVNELFKKDFENSLRASFTVEELKEQLTEANLSQLVVHELDQHYLRFKLVIVTGML